MSKLLMQSSFLLSLFLLLWGCNSWAVPQVKNRPVPAQINLSGAQNLPIAAKILVQKTTINLEVANTQQEQRIGLMFRPRMPADRGMLFNFSPPQPAQFWMKNTLIPLDMLFLHQGIIKNIQTNVPPCIADPCPSYGPRWDITIDQVIELNAGRAATLGLKVGDKLVVQAVSLARSPQH
jgi:uncharacterized protein